MAKNIKVVPSLGIIQLSGSNANTSISVTDDGQLQFGESSNTGSLNVTGDLVVQGSVTAQEFKTEFVSASIIYRSGSTKFGDTADDVHAFTGSLELSGSATINAANSNVLYVNNSANSTAGIVSTNQYLTLNPAGYIVLSKTTLNYQGIWATNNKPYRYTETDGTWVDILNLSGTDNVLKFGTVGDVSTGGDIAFYTSGSEKVRITDDGNLAINATSTSGYKLYVNGNTYLNGSTNYFDGQTILRTASGVTEVMRVASNGNVGIGTTSPSTKLEVSGSVKIDKGHLLIDGETHSRLYLQNPGGSGDSFIAWYDSNANYDWYLGQTSENGGINLYNYTAGGTHTTFNTNGETYFNLGNVGIGTNNPGAKLEVSGSVVISNNEAYRARLTGGGTVPLLNLNEYNEVVMGSTSAGKIVFIPGGVPASYFTSNGLALYHTSPQARLHIRGSGTTSSTTAFRVENANTSASFDIFDDNQIRFYEGGQTKLSLYHSGSGLTTPVLRLANGPNLGLIFKGLTNSPHIGTYSAGSINFSDMGTTGNVGSTLMSLQFGTDTVTTYGDFIVTGDIKTTATSSFTVGYQNDAGNGIIWQGYDGKFSGAIKAVDEQNYQRMGLGFFTGDDQDSTTDAQERMRITRAGNVGIGTTSPTQALTVAGNILQTSNANFIGTRKIIGRDSNGLDLMDDSGANGISIKDGGNVQFTDYGSGNNTGTPAYRLSVDSSGNIIEESLGAGAVDGLGSAGYITRWEDTDTITSSSIYENNGNIGIGTTSPGRKLHVSIDVNDEVARFTSTAGNDAYIELSNANSDGYSKYGVVYNDFVFIPSGSETVRFTDEGRVGIGTTSPTEELHVVGEAIFQGPTYSMSFLGGSDLRGSNQLLVRADNSYLRLQATNNNIYHQAGADHLFEDVNQNKLVAIKQSGNVGIGTTSPSAKLHISSSGTPFKMERAGYDVYGFVQSTGTGLQVQNFTDNRTEMFFDGAGNIGIGTTSPSTVGGTAKLTIDNGGSTSRPISYVNGTTDGMYFRRFGDDGKYQIQTTVGAANSGSLSLQSYGGNVGIGTTSPVELLDVDGTARAASMIAEGIAYAGTGFQHWGDGGTGVNFPANDRIDLDVASTTKIRITNDTDEGILINPASQGWSLGSYNNTSTYADIATIINGSTFGGLITGPNSGHLVVRIKNNDNDDSFAVVANSENSASAAPDKVLFRAKSTGQVEIPGDLTVEGIVTAQEFHTEFVSASIVYQSGSTKFGDTSDDVHQFTGSVAIDGKLDIAYNDKIVSHRADGTEVDLMYINNETIYIGEATSAPSGITVLTPVDSGQGFEVKKSNATDTAFFVENNGNVGIGTSSPTAALHIYDSSNGEVKFERVTGYPGRLHFGFPSGLPTIRTSGNFAIKASDTWGADLYVSSSGNVGIGTTDPRYATLQVQGSGLFSGTLQIQGNINLREDVYTLAHDAQSFIPTITRYDGGSELGLDYDYVRSINGNNGGNVGIGTTAPAAKLEVRGSLLMSGSGTLTAGNLGGTRIDTTQTTISGYYAAEAYARFLIGRDIFAGGQAGIALGGVGGYSYIGTDGTNGNALIFSTDGSNTTGQGATYEKMRIDSSGRLLINATSTTFSDKLYINNDAYTTGGWRVGTSSTYVGKLYNNNGVLSLESDSTRDIQFGSVTNGTAMFIEGSNGNVGIGTTSPQAKLDVSGSAQFYSVDIFNGDQYANPRLRIGRSTAETLNFDVDDYVARIYHKQDETGTQVHKLNLTVDSDSTGGSEINLGFRDSDGSNESTKLIISSSGNVGIGTTTPQRLLDVNGDVRVKQNIFGADGNYVGFFKDGGAAIPVKAGSLTISNNYNDTAPSYGLYVQGDAGIGTTNVSARLHLSGSTGSSILRMQSPSANTLAFNHYSGYSTLRDITLSNNRLLFLDSGAITTPYSIGIGLSGATAPAVPLHVSGTFRHDGSQYNIQLIGGSEIRGSNAVTLRGLNSYAAILAAGSILHTAGTDHIFRDTNSNALVTIKQAGNVGIGTTSPSDKLHVVGDVIFGNESNQKGVMTLRGDNPASNTEIYAIELERENYNPGVANAKISFFRGGSGQDAEIAFFTQESNTAGLQERLRITEAGNVGIGTTTPSAKFHIFSDTHSDFLDNGILLEVSSSDEGEPAIAFRNQSDMGSNYWITGINNGGQNLDFAYGTAFTSANTKVRVTSDGKVGIGNNSPNAKLAIGNNSYNGNLAVAESANNNRVALIGNLEIVNNSTGGSWSGQSIFIPGSNRTFGFVAGGALNAADSNAFAFKASINSNRTVDYTSFNFQGGYNTNTLAADYTFMKIDGAIYQGGINQSGSITGIDYNPNLNYITGSHTAMRLRSGDVLIEDGDLTVGGTITAREFKTEFISASIVYQSGSTKFGDTSDDIHQFTGSLDVSGSIESFGKLTFTSTTSNSIDSIVNLTLNADSDSNSGDAYRNIIFSNRGSEKARIDANGNLGIGTTTPRAKLDIQDSTHGTLMLSRPSETGYAMISGSSGLGFEFKTYDAGEVMAMKITNDGKVGIGTESPNAGLEIANGGNNSTLRITRNGNSSNYLELQGGSSGAIYNINTSGTQDHIFQTGGYEKMRLTSAGDLGIGTSAPTLGKVHVVQSSDAVTEGITVEETSGGNTMRLWMDGSTRKINAGGSNTMIEFDTSKVAFPTGNVGIGTNSPEYKLDIQGDSPILRIADDNTANSPSASAIWMGENGFSEVRGAGIVYDGAANSISLVTSNNGSLTDSNPFNASKRLTVLESNGNVGIGTDSPNQKLHVVGDVNIEGLNPTIYLTDTNGADWNIDLEDNHLRFKVDSTEYIRFQNGGNVGIGTTSPSYKLEVAGTVSGSAFYGDGQNLTNVQRIPKVEYQTLTASIATNDEIGLPNGLTYTTSSNGYEYLEMFVDGIRLSRTLDYAEVSTSTVRYLLNVPSGSVVTYKSLTLV